MRRHKTPLAPLTIRNCMEIETIEIRTRRRRMATAAGRSYHENNIYNNWIVWPAHVSHVLTLATSTRTYTDANCAQDEHSAFGVRQQQFHFSIFIQFNSGEWLRCAHVHFSICHRIISLYSTSLERGSRCSAVCVVHRRIVIVGHLILLPSCVHICVRPCMCMRTFCCDVCVCVCVWRRRWWWISARARDYKFVGITCENAN